MSVMCGDRITVIRVRLTTMLDIVAVRPLPLYRPFRAPFRAHRRIPRALPWAIISRPVGAARAELVHMRYELLHVPPAAGSALKATTDSSQGNACKALRRKTTHEHSSSKPHINKSGGNSTERKPTHPNEALKGRPHTAQGNALGLEQSKGTRALKGRDMIGGGARVRGPRMDWKYLLEAARQLGIEDDLIRRRHEAGI